MNANKLSINKSTILSCIFFLLFLSLEAQETIPLEMVSKIDTSIDPEFIYPFKGTKFVPGDGKTLLIMGQTEDRIKEYSDAFADKEVPGGWSAYWAITEFVGVKESHRNETGSSQNHQMLIDEFPNTALHSALWMVGKWDIAKNAGYGTYDKVIKKYAKWVKKLERPVYLRIGYEFDGPHNELEPREYVRAYQRIVDLMREEGVENVAFVWHSYAAKPYKDYAQSDWYPGDEYVDWVGISVFGHAYSSEGFGSYCDSILEFAKNHQKPVMIAESNPIHGIEEGNSDVWDQWFVNYFSFIYNKNIKAICFINEDWGALNINGIPDWKDARLSNNPVISEAWFYETNKDRYLKQSQELFKLLGYK